MMSIVHRSVCQTHYHYTCNRFQDRLQVEHNNTYDIGFFYIHHCHYNIVSCMKNNDDDDDDDDDDAYQ